jgi:FKBP-type peptidyl-prolyl cis-trans isomerase FkpA
MKNSAGILLAACLALTMLMAAGCDDASGSVALESKSGSLHAQKQKGKAFLEAAAREGGATQTASGLVIKTLKSGNGESPSATDRVTVEYTGKLIDGSVFDTSANRGAATFPLNGLIPCWSEGLQKMNVGETALLTCPSDIAYGDHGHPPTIPGGAVLQFEVELKEIVKPGADR